VATFAPIPSARVSAATIANPGLLINIRNAYRRSWTSENKGPPARPRHPADAILSFAIGRQSSVIVSRRIALPETVSVQLHASAALGQFPSTTSE
jgi:hypothetical protein